MLNHSNGSILSNSVNPKLIRNDWRNTMILGFILGGIATLFVLHKLGFISLSISKKNK